MVIPNKLSWLTLFMKRLHYVTGYHRRQQRARFQMSRCRANEQMYASEITAYPCLLPSLILNVWCQQARGGGKERKKERKRKQTPQPEPMSKLY
jgi:hypothetical protein